MLELFSRSSTRKNEIITESKQAVRGVSKILRERGKMFIESTRMANYERHRKIYGALPSSVSHSRRQELAAEMRAMVKVFNFIIDTQL